MKKRLPTVKSKDPPPHKHTHTHKHTQSLLMFNLSCYEINSKAGATNADENCDIDDATAAGHAFKRIHIANKKLKPFAKRQTISNKLGPKQSYKSTANNDDNNFNSCGIDIDGIIDNNRDHTDTLATPTQLDIHFLWIFVRDLLRNLVSTSDTIEHIENTDQNFEFLTHNNHDFDSIDDSDFLATIHIDGDLNADDYSKTQKLLKQKLLGNFKSIFQKHRKS